MIDHPKKGKKSPKSRAVETMTDPGDCETEEDSAPETCVSPGGGTILACSTSREQRNKAEKQRRDRLNAFISELASLVPMVSGSAKRMDKTSILRLTATYLRIYQTLINGKGITHMQLPKYIESMHLEKLVYEQLGGFLLIVQPSGKIVFVSHTVENLLGHLQTDLMGQTLFNITNPEDHDRLKMFIQCEGDFDDEWKKYFTIRLKRAGPRSETPVYEAVKIMMHKQSATSGGGSVGNGSETPSSSSSGSSISINGDILVFFVKVCRPEPLNLKLIEATRDEYITRHLIDGRIISCDQRISIVAGYMTEEVSGHSAFKYMHRDDVRWVMIALRQMYDRGESKGSSCYRLQSRNGQFIFLRTYGFLEIDDQGTVESFVCINTLVSEPEGVQLINDMKKRYSALINSVASSNGEEYALIPPPTTTTIDLVEDPQEVDQAVARLMWNLPSPTTSHRSTSSPASLPPNENQDYQHQTTTNMNNHRNQQQQQAWSPDNSSSEGGGGGGGGKMYHVKLKPANKRPPNGGNQQNKRQKIVSPQVSPVCRTVSPYQQTSHRECDIKQEPTESMYSSDQMLRRNL